MTPPIDSPGLDRAFSRFCDTGDAEALAVVFDGTAPELLRLAHHLVPDLDLAEDLVQATFLAAIEGRQSYDAAKPVLPWLVGILTNRARLQRRDRGRQPQPDRLRQPRSPQPVQHAETRELTMAVTDAIAGMAEPYPPVLMMHLRHGFSPQEIALTLGRSPGTVRKQLSRGLEMLRRLLPSGFAATVSSTVLPGQGIAAMRDVVLGAARLASPIGAVIAPVALGGLLLMKKTVLTLTAVLAVGSLTYLAWPAATSEDLEPDSTAMGLQLVSRDAARDEAVDRVEVQDATTFEARGVVVRAEDGAPIPDARIALRPITSPREEGPLLASAGSGPDGSFCLQAPPLARGSTLSISAASRAEARHSTWERQGLLDLGEIRLFPSVAIRGCVLDEAIGPLAGFQLSLLPTTEHPISPLDVTAVARSFTARTDERGEFEIANAAVPGVWSFRLPLGYEIVRPEELRLMPGEHPYLELVVRRALPGESLSGLLVDDRGQPISGAPVSAVAASAVLGPLRDASTTDAEGRFHIERRRVTADDVRVVLSSHAYELLSSADPVRWGRDDLRLVARRPAVLEVIVREAESGVLVREFDLRAYDLEARVLRLAETGFQEHAGGMARMELRPGRSRILVTPRSSELSTSEPIEVEVPVHGRSIEVALRRQRPVQVLVRTPGGTGVSSSTVQLISQHGAGGLGPDARILNAPTALRREPPFGVLLDDGTTNAAGRVTLHGAGERLVVRAVGPGHPPVQRSITQDGPVVLDVGMGSTVRGTLSPPDGLGGLRAVARNSEMRVELHPLDGPAWVPEQVAAVGAGGTFTFTGVPPGDWRVVLELERQVNRFHSVDVYELPGVVFVRSGEDPELNFDVSRLVHGTMRARMFVDGEIAASTGFYLIDPDSLHRSLARADSICLVRSDERGMLELLWRPGRWAIAARQGDGYAVSDTEVEVLPGTVTDGVFQITQRVLRIRILEADGAPAIDRIFDDGEGPVTLTTSKRTDADGWIVLDPAPIRGFDLWTFPRGMDYDEILWRQDRDPAAIAALRTKVGRMEKTEGGGTVSAEMQIPAGR